MRLPPRRVGFGVDPATQAAQAQAQAQAAQQQAQDQAAQAQAQVQATQAQVQGQIQNVQNQALGTVTPIISNVLDQTSTTILQGLPTSVQAALSTGQSYLAQGQPAFNLASTIASGGTPTGQQLILGLAAVAGAINPLAGAMLAVAGEAAVFVAGAFQSLYTALGLYTTPPPTWVYVGLLRLQVDPLPFPPLADGTIDPAWMSFLPVSALTCNIASDVQDFGLPCVIPPNIPNTYSPDVDSATRNTPYLNLLATALTRLTPQPVPGGTPPTAFEQYFNALLVQNLTYWANGQPFVPVRSLLAGTVTAWNASHGGPAVLFQPGTTAEPFGISPSQYVLAPLGASTAVYASTITWILSPIGGEVDGNSSILGDSPALPINSPDGSNDLNARNIGSGAASTPVAQVAAATLAVPLGVAMGAVAYSLALGQARTAALKGLWRWLMARV
jgi:hypothetical protein